jgi:hypothetical protein
MSRHLGAMEQAVGVYEYLYLHVGTKPEVSQPVTFLGLSLCDA